MKNEQALLLRWWDTAACTPPPPAGWRLGAPRGSTGIQIQSRRRKEYWGTNALFAQPGGCWRSKSWAGWGAEWFPRFGTTHLEGFSRKKGSLKPPSLWGRHVADGKRVVAWRGWMIWIWSWYWVRETSQILTPRCPAGPGVKSPREPKSGFGSPHSHSTCCAGWQHLMALSTSFPSPKSWQAFCCRCCQAITMCLRKRSALLPQETPRMGLAKWRLHKLQQKVPGISYNFLTQHFG